VEFVDALDASEAQYHMNRQMFAGREITVVLAADTRKRPEDMCRRTKPRYGISISVMEALSVFHLV
jgi:FUS-interacting serine-arginine-rich protein 1